MIGVPPLFAVNDFRVVAQVELNPHRFLTEPAADGFDNIFDLVHTDMSNSVEAEAQNSVTKPAARKCPLCVNASVSPKRRITANEM